MFTRSLVHCLVATLALFLCGSVQADTWQFNVSLSGLQEVPPNASPATGTAIVLFDDATGAMSVNGSFTGLLGVSSAAHVHGFAPPGVNIGVQFPLTITPGFAGTISGNGVFAGANIPNVLNGLTYINIHSAAFPGGEIRGQIANGFVIPEPGSLAVLGGLALASLVSRRRRR